VRLAAAAEAVHAAADPTTRPDLDDLAAHLGHARRDLDAATFARARAAGRAMTSEQAAAEALADAPAPSVAPSYRELLPWPQVAGED